MTTRDTIAAYYKGLKEKQGWQSVIADQIHFDRPQAKTVTRAEFIEATNSFLEIARKVEIDKYIIKGKQAWVIARYQLVSPSGRTSFCEIAEFFNVKHDKIHSLKIIFDTAVFREFVENE
jgi:hypothetical protein